MGAFGLELWDDEGTLVTFYTIRKEGAAETETDKFFLEFGDHFKYGHYVEALATFILETMGNSLGARATFFRFENAAAALPPEPHMVRGLELNLRNFPLRLYCYRMSSSLVVLMNGGVKSAASAQESKDLSMKFYEANSFAKAIERALQEGELEVADGGRYLLSGDGEEDIVVYGY